MLNTNKINRVKGILSARDGTQVPKFFDGGVADWYRNYNKALFSSPKANVTEDWLKENDLDAWNVWNKHIQTEKEKAEAAEANNPAYTERAKELASDAFKISSKITDKGLEFTSNAAELTTPKITIPEPKLETLDKPGINAELIGEEQSYNGASAANGGGTQGDYNLIEVPKQDTSLEDAAKADKAAKDAKMASTAKGMAVAGQVADMTRSALFSGQAANDSGTTQGINGAYDAISNSLMGFAPVGTIVGGAMKVGALAGDAMQALGGGTDQMTTADKIMDSSFFSWNIGAINGFGGKKTDSFAADQDTLSKVGGSYGGTTSDIMDAQGKAGKKYGLFSSSARKKANRAIADARSRQSIMAGISQEASDRKAGAQDRTLQQSVLSYEQNMLGGYDQRYLRAAKSGAKIQYFKEPFKVNLSDVGDFKIELTPATSILKNGGAIIDTISAKYTNKFEVSLTDPIDLEMFKQGGNISEKIIDVIETNTNQKSVIPEGALHKNKHHLDQVGVDDSELTKKGIPVVDNDGDQQAEIELNEIIFTLEVTKELESRYKEFYESETNNSRKDELAIEAGKLLWKEILYNTDDRTGLIDTLKQGGTLLAKEGNKVDDAFQKFLETLPDNQRNYSEDTYRMRRYWELNGKPKDFKEALEKEMFTLEDDGFYHARSVAYNPELDEYEFMKMPGHKTTWMEEEGWYNGMDFIPKEGLTEEQADGVKDNYILTPKKGRDAEESRRFREKYELDKSGSFWKYVPRNRKNIKKDSQGGNITQEKIDQMVKQAFLNLLK